MKLRKVAILLCLVLVLNIIFVQSVVFADEYEEFNIFMRLREKFSKATRGRASDEYIKLLANIVANKADKEARELYLWTLDRYGIGSLKLPKDAYFLMTNLTDKDRDEQAKVGALPNTINFSPMYLELSDDFGKIFLSGINSLLEGGKWPTYIEPKFFSSFTFFHESGHAIDHNIPKEYMEGNMYYSHDRVYKTDIFESIKLKDAIEYDVEKHIESTLSKILHDKVIVNKMLQFYMYRNEQFEADWFTRNINIWRFFNPRDNWLPRNQMVTSEKGKLLFDQIHDKVQKYYDRLFQSYVSLGVADLLHGVSKGTILTYYYHELKQDGVGYYEEDKDKDESERRSKSYYYLGKREERKREAADFVFDLFTTSSNQGFITWEGNHRIGAEAFAHYFAYRMLGDREGIAFFKTHLPQSTQILEKMLTEMHQRAKPKDDRWDFTIENNHMKLELLGKIEKNVKVSYFSDFNEEKYKKYMDETIYELSIPEGVDEINSNAFTDLTDLRVVHLPSSIQSIHEIAFKNSSNLQVITHSDLNKLNKLLEEGNIADENLKKATPMQVDNFNQARAQQLANLENHWYSDNEYYHGEDRAVLAELYIKNQKNLIVEVQYPDGKKLKASGAVFLYPRSNEMGRIIRLMNDNTETKIFNELEYTLAFENGKDHLFLHSQVENVSYLFFKEEPLVPPSTPEPTSTPTSPPQNESNPPTNAELIDYGTCGRNLEWKLVGNTLHIYGEGGMDDFLFPEYSTSKELGSIAPPWAKGIVKNVIIYEGVQTIEWGAFSHRIYLENVFIPLSVQGICEWSFYETPNLKFVHYAGSQADWNRIQFSTFAPDREMQNIEIAEYIPIETCIEAWQ